MGTLASIKHARTHPLNWSEREREKEREHAWTPASIKHARTLSATDSVSLSQSACVIIIQIILRPLQVLKNLVLQKEIYFLTFEATTRF
jgi:hypothetical protein